MSVARGAATGGSRFARDLVNVICVVSASDARGDQTDPRAYATGAASSVGNSRSIISVVAAPMEA